LDIWWSGNCRRCLISRCSVGNHSWTNIVETLFAALIYLFSTPRHQTANLSLIVKEHLLMAAATTLAVKCLTIPAKAKHTATVVFVHVSISVYVGHILKNVLLIISSFSSLQRLQGLGDTGYGWQPVADMFKVDPDLAHVKWVLPHSYVFYILALS